MLDLKAITKNINTIKRLLIKIWLGVACLELLIFHNIDTFIALLFSVIGLIICGVTIFNTKNLLYYPVSTIAVIMYPFFFLFLPPIATLLEFKPVVYNLHSPFNTYLQIVLLESLLIFIHGLYKKLSRTFRLKKLLEKCGVYTQLTHQELWFTILLSTVCFVLSIMLYGLYNDEGENVRSELPLWMQIVQFVFGSSYSLVLIFYMRNFNVIKGTYKTLHLLIWFIVALVMVVGISTNMRTASIMCFSTGLFMFIVYNFYYPIDLRKFFTPKRIILYSLAVYFFTGPFMDISRAMLLTRGSRYGLSGVEVLEMTLSNMGKNTKEEKEYKSTSRSWDEEYLSNHILNRFCSVKIHDETIYHAQQLGYSNAQMRECLEDKLLDDLPGVIKQKLGFTKNEDIRKYSLTDKLGSLSIGAPLGGVKIGSLQGLGLALWGWWYLIVLIPIYVILFYLLDSLVYYKNNTIKFSYLFLFNVGTFVYWFSDRHYYQWEFRWIFRTYWESLIFFLVFLFVIKRIPFLKH